MNFNVNEDNTMQYLGWDELNIDMFPHYRTKQDKPMKVFTKNGFIAYQRSYYLVVSGKMPLLSAKAMFENAKDLEIRVNGGSNDAPEFHNAKHDDIIKHMDSVDRSIEGFDGWSEKYEKKRNQLIKDDPNGFYIKCYHIDKKQGIKAFTDMITNNNIKTSFIKED